MYEFVKLDFALIASLDWVSLMWFRSSGFCSCRFHSNGFRSCRVTQVGFAHVGGNLGGPHILLNFHEFFFTQFSVIRK